MNYTSYQWPGGVRNRWGKILPIQVDPKTVEVIGKTCQRLQQAVDQARNASKRKSACTVWSGNSNSLFPGRSSSKIVSLWNKAKKTWRGKWGGDKNMMAISILISKIAYATFPHT